MKPLVSVLVPAHNAEKWIGDTLRSAISQTWDNLEIIVVDDGSKDRTLEVASQFTSHGVRIVSQENHGASAARNLAFSMSHGDYIQWLDADDLLSQDKIARQMAVAEQIDDKKTLISCSWGRFLHRYYRAKFVPTALWCDLLPKEWLLRKMGQNLYMQTATWLVSRDLTIAAAPWDTRLLGDDDGEYFCRVLLASDKVRFVPDAKVYYRTSGCGSLSYIGDSDRKRDAQWLSMQLHIKYLQSLGDSERTRAVCVKYLENWGAIFYTERPDLFKQANEMASHFGRQLEAPRMSWKYTWIGRLLGLRIAWRTQGQLSRLKLNLLMHIDKILYRLHNTTLNLVRPGPRTATWISSDAHRY
jgi:glycosyltransferase involved in cell wall biosynthesis